MGQADTQDVIEWFKTLPLFLADDFPFRVIHACWDQEKIDHTVKYFLNDDKSLKEEVLLASANKTDDDPFSPFETIERLLKGVEVRLPKPHYFFDKDGKKRHHIRVNKREIH